jgi:hypothetical protein
VIPANIAALIRHPLAMAAMMTMKKIDIVALEVAASSNNMGVGAVSNLRKV